MKSRVRKANKGFMVQTTDGRAADNESFVEMLAAQTLQAKASGGMLANKPEIDFLLRLAGTTQISRAIRERGTRQGAPFLLVAAGQKEPRWAPAPGVKQLPRRKLTMSELDKIERAALLNAKRP